MDAQLEAYVRELKDRQEIYERIATYCRGIDRLDRACLESVYHPDAIDDHGVGVFCGPASQFIDWVLDFHVTNQQRTLHQITTHICDLDGDVAHTESYYIYRALDRSPISFQTAYGRYIDRFEKRDGRWAITERICTVDIFDPTIDPNGDIGDWGQARTARDRTDPCFQRPLTIDRSRFTV